MEANSIERTITDDSGEEKLWRAVIANTVREWLRGPVRLRREAERFLFYDNEDFKTVCYSAGINPWNLRERLQRIAKALEGCSARTAILDADDGESLPLLELVVDETALGRSAFQVCRRLRSSSPPCYVGHGGLREGKLTINPLHLDDERAARLAARLREELSR
jgi:hypothetical protein